MRQLLVGLLLVAFLPGALAAAPLTRRELRVAAPSNDQPFAYLDEDGTVRGFTVDVARALCRRLEVQCTLVTIEVLDPVPLLQSRSVDLVPAVAITEPRRRVLDFTERYYRSPGRLVAPRGRGLEPTANALADRVIGVQRGTTQDRFAGANFTRSTLRRYSDRTELFLDLALGRLDAAFTNVIAARTEFLDTELGAGFEFAGPALDDPAWFGEGVGIAVRKGDEQLRAALDDALRELRGSGRLDAIRRRYVSFGID